MKSLIIVCIMGLISIFECYCEKENVFGEGVTCGGLIYDVDGNAYKTVRIGNQCWMAENYRLNYAGSKVYADNEANRVLYGGLYDGNIIENIDFAIIGWHVSTKLDWEAMFSYMGLSYAVYSGWGLCGTVEGGWLKSIRTDPDVAPRWNSLNVGAIDKYGFGAMPAGVYSNSFYYVGSAGYFWVNDDLVNDHRDVELQNGDSKLHLSTLPKIDFVSVRLVKD